MSVICPAAIARCLESSDIPGNVLLLSVQSDLDLSGRIADIWLIATNRCVAVLEVTAPAGDSCRCLAVFKLSDLEDCRTQAQVGSGYLQFRRHDVWIDVARFSNQRIPAFRELAEQLNLLRRDNRWQLPDNSDCQRQCAQCGTELGDHAFRCGRCQPSFGTFRRVIQMLQPFYRSVLAILTLSVVAVLIELIPPWLQKILVDQVLNRSSAGTFTSHLLTTLGIIVGSLALVRITAAGISVVKSAFSSEIGTRLTANLRSQLVEKLERQSISFHDRNQVGLLMSRVAYDTEAMHTFMHHLSSGFLLQILQLFAIGCMLFVLNPKLALITLLPTPLVMLTSWFFCKRLYVRNHRYWEAVGRQATALTSLLSGIRVVKSFTQESREHARFSGASERLRESRVSVDLANATFSSLVGLLFGLGGLIVWYVGGRDVLQAEMTLGSLMAFLAYLSMFYAPLTTVSEGASWMSNFLSASHRIFDLLDTPIRVSEPAAAKPIDRLSGHIRFENVTFSYDAKSPVLEKFSLEISPGSAVGIVGRSGSGKSTLASLVSRLYDVDAGQITIDGIDVRDMSSLALRRRVGVVLQEPFLFQGTVSDNIAYGDPQADLVRILSAAKAASAHQFIMRLPFGYDSMLGERGTGLSGGERQRISIARAILYDPQILILDEATSSVDSESEQLIRSALQRFSKGRTTLAIAHRLSTLERADRLIVMDQGRIIEDGTHQELIQRNGLYSRFVRLQFGSPHSHSSQGLDQSQCDLTDNGSTLESNSISEAEDINWLLPEDAKFYLGIHDTLMLEFGDRRYEAVYAVRAFPATHSESLLSLRYTDDRGCDLEIGMVKDLAAWSAETQHLIRRSLNRRYLLRIVTSLVSIRLDHQQISCVALVDNETVEFDVPNSPHKVIRFGARGYLLTDVHETLYLIPDLDRLPYLQRQFFRLNFLEV